MSTIDERLDRRDNALNLIRIVLAAFVLVEHGLVLSGAIPERRLGDFGLGLLAVGGFFGISGYLITASRMARSFWIFALHRFFRLYPAFWAALIVTAFLIAPTAAAINGSWDVGAAFNYVLRNAPMVAGGVPVIGDSLAGSPYPGTWNGSLWTLRYELLCYVLVGVALSVPYLRRTAWAFVVAFAATTLAAAITATVDMGGGTIRQLTVLLPYFAAGALLYKFRASVPSRAILALGCAAAIAMIAIFSPTAAGVAAPLPLAYLLMYLGSVVPRPIRRAGQVNDYSYGTYVYAFPLQQLIVIVGGASMGWLLYLVLSFAATAIFAVASWHVVEKPAMNLAKRLGTRKLGVVS